MTEPVSTTAPAAAPVSAASALMGDPAAADGAAPAPAAASVDPAAPAADPAAPAAPAPLVMPSKDATPEEWSAFYAQIGRPETPDGYELPVPDGDNGEFAKSMAPVLHKHGVTAEQAKGLAADWNDMVAKQVADMNAVLGGTLLIGAIFIGLNLLSDLLYTLLDPRVRRRVGQR